jgi:hypothetical protein
MRRNHLRRTRWYKGGRTRLNRLPQSGARLHPGNELLEPRRIDGQFLAAGPVASLPSAW